MEEIRYKDKIKNCCLEREVAFCVSSCPFHLDIPEFIKKIRRNAFASAYRMYSNAVGFPAIVAQLCDEPCKSVCPRSSIDGAVSLRQLEAAAVQYTSNRKPNNYNLPAKEKHVAIVGAGISGLAAALRLTNKKYRVSVYERENRIGGHLWNLLEPELFLSEIERQFTFERLDWLLNAHIEDFFSLTSRYDAVYIATGEQGAFDDLRPELLAGAPVASNLERVFLGGGTLGANPIESMAQGLRAANVIEAFLKTGNMKSAPAYTKTKMILDRGVVSPSPVITPEEGQYYTKEEAIAESERCLQCRCDACHRHCALLSYFDKFPKKLEEEVHATIFPGSLDGNGTIATRFISTCNQCGLCAEVCPININLGQFLRNSHRIMHDKGAMPWAFHEFWLRDMEHAVGDSASLIAGAIGINSSQYAFFPGCQLGASDPRYVLEPYNYLRKEFPNIAIWLNCCGAPAIWSGDMNLFHLHVKTLLLAWGKMGKPRVILACPSCKSFFEEFLPEVETIMFYDALCGHDLNLTVIGEEHIVSVFDPCSSRYDKSIQDNIREIVQSAGYQLSPLPYERSKAQCCSWGGQISTASPAYSAWLTRVRVAESDFPYIVYCSNCRDIFADTGKPVKHILDVIFNINDWHHKPPTASQRRKNREYLKISLINKYLATQTTEQCEMPITESRLFLTEALREKISKARLIEDDLLTVIEECEKEGKIITNTATLHRFASMEIGHLTHWVEYMPQGNGYELFNAYSHRMKIEENVRS